MRALKEGRTDRAAQLEDELQERAADRAMDIIFQDDAVEPDLKRQRTPAKGHVFFRGKSELCLVELDNALKGYDDSAGGLKEFQLPSDWENNDDVLSKCEDWKCLTISADQGPDMWCAQNWLDWKGFVTIREPDQNHGWHNDWLGTGFDCGLGPLMFAMCVALNFVFLPFRDGRFGRALVCTVNEMRALSNVNDRVFRIFEDDIAIEKGFTDGDRSDNKFDQMVWEAFLDTKRFRAYGSKVGMTRWGQIFLKLVCLVADWSSLLCALIRMCVDEKWMADGAFSKTIAALRDSSRLPGAGDSAATTKESSAEEIKALRSACKKATFFTVALLSDPMNKRRAANMGHLTAATTKEYSDNAKRLTSLDESLAWHLEQQKVTDFLFVLGTPRSNPPQKNPTHTP